jgi:type II secretory pathway pseudopilin PulG
MNLERNASRAFKRDHGYAMAALLVAMAVMAILMSVALPTWKQTLRREKEEELIFRGNQYARAIGAYQRKYANASPASIDVLIEQHLLRKKYKDPLAPTDDVEFAPLYVNNRGGGAGPAGQSAAAQAAASAAASTTPSGGGIIGVASKNTSESIRTFNDKNHYNEWQFMALQQSIRGGGAGPGTGAGGLQQQGGQRPGGPGGQGGQGTQGGRNPQGQGGGGYQAPGGYQGPGGRSQTQGR